VAVIQLHLSPPSTSELDDDDQDEANDLGNQKEIESMESGTVKRKMEWRRFERIHQGGI